MTTLLNAHESGWKTADLSVGKSLSGGKAVCVVGIRSANASPITDVTFDAVGFNQDVKHDVGNVVAELWSLAVPAVGSKLWAIDEATNGEEYYAVLMEWDGRFVVYQFAGKTPAATDGTTETLTNTTVNSKVYFALHRDGSAGDTGLTVDGDIIVHPAQSPGQRAFILSEKDGTGGSVSFTWSATNARQTSIILFEVKTPAGGNQAIWVL